MPTLYWSGYLLWWVMVQLQGVLVALVTPMCGHDIDFKAFKGLIQYHCAAGTDAVVILGTTGEAGTLTEQERTQLITLAVETAQKKLPIWVGTGSQSTAQACLWSKQAEVLGAQGCMVVTPYYVRPTQPGIVAHFRHISQATTLPLMVYDVPKRTGCVLELATLKTLHESASIVAYKDATNDLSRVSWLRNACPRWSLLSGDDLSCSAFIFAGGHGIVSVVANCLPQYLQKMVHLIRTKDLGGAFEIEAAFYPIAKLLAQHANPIMIKWLLHQLGMISIGIRLPLLWFNPEEHQGAVEVVTIIKDIQVFSQ
jgi:4-hydroxy-tetrahydrodipicolinate synthase